MSWQDADLLCQFLTARIGGKVSLPTEAQWEYAARGSAGRKYPWGDSEPTERLANFDMNVGDTTPVGAFPDGATSEGVHDLAGNVWEWCHVWYVPYSNKMLQDPTGPPKGSERVLRGGSFINEPQDLRSAFRFRLDPVDRSVGIGFRCVWAAPTGP